jgi:hypothetical protein
MGDNSNMLTDSEEVALKMEYLRKRMAHKAKIAEVQAAMKVDANLCKADGISVWLIDFGIKALSAEDKKTPIQRLMDQGKMLEDLCLIPKWNGDLLADRATKEERIFADGKMKGMAGVDKVSGYAAASADDVTWRQGYEEGQRIMREDLPSAQAKKVASRTKEAPPPGSDDPFGRSDENYSED